MEQQVIQRRFVLLGGYYPIAPEETRRRLARDHGRFCKTWSLTGSVTEEPQRPAWLPAQIKTHGPDWQSQVSHNHFFWDDLIAEDRTRSWAQRLPLALITFFDFIRRGALTNYFRIAWRYAGFFLYPFVLLFALMGLAWMAAGYALPLLGTEPGNLWRWPLAALIFAALLPTAANGLRLDHLIDDWIYARRIAHAGDAAVSQRLALLAEDLAQETEREILIVGHSFGAVHAIELINAIRARAPDGPPIRFASMGSSILKIALYGGAEKFRTAIETMAKAKNVIWFDIYAVNDYMNFCDADPVKTLGLSGEPARTLKVQFRGMISEDYYKKMQRNFFRIHSQFIAVNDRIAPYDYFMLMCGPFPLEVAARDRRGFLDLLDEKAARKAQAQTP